MTTTLGRIAALAADRRVHRAFHWLHLHELQLRQWQLEMIAIPAPPFAESARAGWFLARFAELGLANIHLDEIGNALAIRSPSKPATLNPGPSVLLSAHLDTVFPSGTVCTPEEDGTRILAPGACDNAAGLTALLAIAAALQFAELAPACPILFAANVGEEGAGDLRGMRHIFSGAHNIAAAIALEGSGNATVVDRALGSRRFRITLTGPGGHSWADAALPNPIFALSEALAAISRQPLPSTPRTTLHCGTISGGTSVNSIPESATADLDLRSASSDQLDVTEAQLLHTIRTTIDAANARNLLTLEIARIGNRPAATLAANSPLLASLRAVDRHLHIATESRIGSTDANWPLSLGIPALAIGAGGTAGGIHTLHEWYDPTGRELALRRILLHLLEACTVAAESSSAFPRSS
ncbi:MAG TPA: M20/M25/M40 family metallo-hydrolase [Acidobacteriaceae bacterium]|nr:M20/M25/M40 family metallo-hydrolase [Acidobacteriaceae bacterium]